MLQQEYPYDKEIGGLEDAFLHNFIIPMVWRTWMTGNQQVNKALLHTQVLGKYWVVGRNV